MTWQVLQGDCIEVMAEMDEASVDAVVCDPPYGLSREPNIADVLTHWLAGDDYEHRGGGFMGQTWDSFVPGPSVWRECLRVLKPGGHLLAFAGSRTADLMGISIRTAGFEIRDSIMFLYGAGFPKSHNLDRLRGEQFCGCEAEPATQHDLRDVPGEDVQASEAASGRQGPVLLEGVSKPGSPEDRAAARDRDAGQPQPGLEGRSDLLAEEGQLSGDQVLEGAGVGAADGSQGRVHHGAPPADGGENRSPADARGSGSPSRPRSDEQRAEQPGALADQRLAQDGRGWPDCDRCGLPAVPCGLGTALKPSHEPIVVARKPLVGTVAETVLEYGTGAINIDACRIGTDTQRGERYRGSAPGGGDGSILAGPKQAEAWDAPAGRWPANAVFSHLEDCEQVGTVVVKGDQRDTGAGRRPSGFADIGAELGDGEPNASVYGNEEAAVWECAPGCPVAALDAQTGDLKSGTAVGGLHRRSNKTVNCYGEFKGERTEGDVTYGDSGGASRFFYRAKTSRAERNAGLGPEFAAKALNWSSGEESPGTFQADGTERAARNHHPTVKPINLMRWLVRLVTPPNGLILDPFLGSGTTGCAAVLEGFDFIGIEREPEYIAIAEARIRFWAKHPGREVEDVLGLVAKSSRESKAHANRGQTTIYDLDVEAAA